MSENQGLSERELEILKLVATGASNKEIAHNLNISTNTVKVHIKNIFSKTGAVSRTEAAMYAVQTGVVKPNVLEETYSSGEPLQPILGEGDDTKNIGRKRGNLWLSSLLTVVILVGLGLISWLTIRGGLSNASQTSNINNPEAQLQNNWLDCAPMSLARSGHAAIVLENSVLVIGGNTDDGVTGLVERYDFESDTWSELATKTYPVANIGAVAIGGLVYVPGGSLDDGSPINVMEVYNPRLDRWEESEQLPISMCCYAITAYEGKLYIFGGWDGSNYLDTVYEFNPIDRTWKMLLSMPFDRAYAQAVIAGNRIYLVGGKSSEGAINTVDRLASDFLTESGNSWDIYASMPVSKYQMGVTSLAERIYIIGGIVVASEADVLIDSLELNTMNGQIRELENPTDGSWSAMAVVAHGGNIYTMGGVVDGSVTDIVLRNQVVYSVALPVIR